MKGHLSKRGTTRAYWFDITPDPLTGKASPANTERIHVGERGMERVPDRDR
jgi:hypothetical protein